MRYRNDPRWITAKYAGQDANGLQFVRGDRIFFYPATKTVLSGDAAEQASRDFEAAIADEEGF